MPMKYAGATPLIVGTRKGGHTTLACPRPLSRKKLRRLMSRNHRELTSEALATRYNRRPGGAAAKRMREQLDHLERAARKAGEQAMSAVHHTMLLRLRRLFLGHSAHPPAARKERKARAKRG